MSKPTPLNITEDVEKATELISRIIFDMRQDYEEGDIMVGLLLATIFFQHQLKVPFEVIQEMMLNLRMSVDDAEGIEKSKAELEKEMAEQNEGSSK